CSLELSPRTGSDGCVADRFFQAARHSGDPGLSIVVDYHVSEMSRFAERTEVGLAFDEDSASHASAERKHDGVSTVSCRYGSGFRDQRRYRSEEHTSELQSRENLVCRLLLEKENKE